MEEPEKFIRCKRCNRVLTNNEAMSRGYGVHCFKKFLEENRKEQPTLFNVKKAPDKEI